MIWRNSEATIKQDLNINIREGMKALIEQILEEEMTDQIPAYTQERISQYLSKQSGDYHRDLLTTTGAIEQFCLPHSQMDPRDIIYKLVASIAFRAFCRPRCT